MKCSDCLEEILRFEDHVALTCKGCSGRMHLECAMMRDADAHCESCFFKAEKRYLDWAETPLKFEGRQGYAKAYRERPENKEKARLYHQTYIRKPRGDA